MIKYFVCFLTLSVVCSTVLGQLCCPDGWTIFRESCYYFTHSMGMSFIEAEHYCAQHKAHLVHIDDREENLFVKDYLTRLHTHNYWMGLTDEGIEGLHKWIDTDTTPEFTDWSPGQPDDHGHLHDEDCALFWANHEFTWNDGRCNATLQAVCEMTVPGSMNPVVG